MSITRRIATCASLLLSLSLGACAQAGDVLAPQGWNPQTGAGNVSFYPQDGTVRNLRTGAVVAQVPSPNAQDLWMAGDGTVSHLVVRGALGSCPAQHIVVSTDGVRAHVERVGRCGETLRFTETRNGVAAVNARGDTWLYPETSNEVRRTGFVVGNGVYRGPEVQAGAPVRPNPNDMGAYRGTPAYQGQGYAGGNYQGQGAGPVLQNGFRQGGTYYVPPGAPVQQPSRPAYRTNAPAQGYVPSTGYVPAQSDRSLLPGQAGLGESLWNSPRVDLR